MGYEFLEVTSPEDLHALASITWDASQKPWKPFFRLLYPKLGDGPAAQREEIDGMARRWRSRFWGDPSLHWVKAVDTDSGLAVACVCYIIRDAKPAQQGKTAQEEQAGPPPGFWQPEGPRRNFVVKALGQSAAIDKQYDFRPQFYVQIAATRRAYQRQGLAGRLMEWMMNIADEKGLQCFLSATPPAVPLYEKYGFRVIEFTELCPVPDGGDSGPKWSEIEDLLSPIPHFPMWRPLNGVFESGRTKKPWLAL